MKLLASVSRAVSGGWGYQLDLPNGRQFTGPAEDEGAAILACSRLSEGAVPLDPAEWRHGPGGVLFWEVPMSEPVPMPLELYPRALRSFAAEWLCEQLQPHLTAGTAHSVTWAGAAAGFDPRPGKGLWVTDGSPYPNFHGEEVSAWVADLHRELVRTL